MSENSKRTSVLIKELLVMNRDDAAKKKEDQFAVETKAGKSKRKKIRQELVQVLNVRDSNVKGGERPE